MREEDKGRKGGKRKVGRKRLRSRKKSGGMDRDSKRGGQREIARGGDIRRNRRIGEAERKDGQRGGGIGREEGRHGMEGRERRVEGLREGKKEEN